MSENKNQKNNMASLKKGVFWGLPLVVLFVLIYLLINELIGDDIRLFQAEPESAISSIAPGDSPGEEEIVTEPEKSGVTSSISAEPVVDTETQDSESTVEPESLKAAEVIQPEETESEPLKTEAVIQEQPGETIVAPDIKKVAIKKVESLEKEDLPYSKIQETLPPEQSNEELEISYIVEKGDNLWKIASKSDVLNNPWDWKTILVQNQDKVNFTIVSEETGEWKVIIEAGKKLNIKPEKIKKKKSDWERPKKKQYALQLISLELDKLEIAVDLVKLLIKDGYYAYLYRTKEKIKTKTNKGGSFFYRVRTGFFASEKEALGIGHEIFGKYGAKRLFPSDYWPVIPSYSELNGDLIDFGIQRTRPWIIQLDLSNSRNEAIKSFKSIVPYTDFSYISQKKLKEKEGFQYRTRVGFYEDEKSAQKALENIREKSEMEFTSAEILEIKNVMESAPGQSTGVTNLREIPTSSSN